MTIRTAIDGCIVNSGARLYRKFNNTHLVPVTSEAGTDNTLCLVVRTSQSNVHVAQAARTEVILEGQRVEIQRRSLEEPGYVAVGGTRGRSGRTSRPDERERQDAGGPHRH